MLSIGLLIGLVAFVSAATIMVRGDVIQRKMNKYSVIPMLFGAVLIVVYGHVTIVNVVMFGYLLLVDFLFLIKWPPAHKQLWREGDFKMFFCASLLALVATPIFAVVAMLAMMVTLLLVAVVTKRWGGINGIPSIPGGIPIGVFSLIMLIGALR